MCSIYMDQISFIRHMVSSERVSIYPAMVKGVIGFDQPINIENVYRFLRQVIYYRHFIQDFSYVTHPIKNLIKKGLYFNWDPECKESILEIKCQLAIALVLVFPDNVKL